MPTVMTSTVTRYLLRAFNRLGEPVYVPGYYEDIYPTGELAQDWYERQMGFVEDALSAGQEHPLDPSWRVEIIEHVFPVRDYLLNDEKVAVLLEEEYGWREYIWHTGMAADKLGRLFRLLNNTHGACPPSVSDLPGKLVPFWLQDDSRLGCWSVDPETYKEEEWEGLATRADHLVFLPWRDSMNCAGSVWSAHFHMRDDTYFHFPEVL